jgi:hypothetical protein
MLGGGPLSPFGSPASERRLPPTALPASSGEQARPLGEVQEPRRVSRRSAWLRAPWAVPIEAPVGAFTDPVFTPLPPWAEVLVITHVLELPRDLGLAQDQPTATALFEPRDDLFVGWPDEAKAHLVHAPAVPSPGMSPVTRLVLRHTWVRARPPLVAADKCFEDFVKPLLPRRAVRARLWQRRLAGLVGVREPVTVVAATRFLPPQD